MAYKVTTLDKRHKGNRYFRYYVTINSPLSTFVEMRNWAWETYGPGTERDLSLIENQIWAWHHSQGERPRLYFKTQKELSWFELRWGDESI